MMSSSYKNVFIIGPGYIGWNVLELLVNEGYTVSALVRRQAHAEGIQKSGGTAIQGDLDNHDLIAKHVAENDVTIHTATADHLPSIRAVLDGVKERAESGKSTIFIHTSGTSVLDDGSLGAFKSDRIYYDNDPTSIDAVPDKAPHRQIDLAIVRARKELGDKAKLAIMIPPTIYGFDQKHKRGSIQIPTITRFALKNGYVGHVGKGLSVESQVHFLDLARGYVVLLHHIESSPPSEVLENPYFFCENGKDYSFKEAAEEIGKALHTRGIIDDATPREFKKADYNDLFGEVTPALIGLNARSRAVRLRALGWEPKEKGIWECFNEDELPEILAEDNVGKQSRYGGLVPY